MSIRWNEFDPQGYEDMVSVLLSRLYPHARRIDGKGGDGGRDVQIAREEDDPITNAFELKSFTGRITPGRRKQVARSLKRTAAHSSRPEAHISVMNDLRPLSLLPFLDVSGSSLHIGFLTWYLSIHWSSGFWYSSHIGWDPSSSMASSSNGRSGLVPPGSTSKNTV